MPLLSEAKVSDCGICLSRIQTSKGGRGAWGLRSRGEGVSLVPPLLSPPARRGKLRPDLVVMLLKKRQQVCQILTLEALFQSFRHQRQPVGTHLFYLLPQNAVAFPVG